MPSAIDREAWISLFDSPRAINSRIVSSRGDNDRVAPLKEVMALIEKQKTQKGIAIEHAVIPEANHFFEDCMDELQTVVGAYLDKRLGMPRHAPPSLRKDRAKPVAPPREIE